MFKKLTNRIIITFLSFTAFSVSSGCFSSAGGDEGTAKPPKLEEEIAEKIEAFFARDHGDTAVQKRENERKEFEKIAKLFDGRKLQLNFPVDNLSGEQTKYQLLLQDPHFPGPLKYDLLESVSVALSKKDAVRVSNSSSLEITGRIKLTYRDRWAKPIVGVKSKQQISVIAWMGDEARRVELAIDKPVLRIATVSEDGKQKTYITIKPLAHCMRGHW